MKKSNGIMTPKVKKFKAQVCNCTKCGKELTPQTAFYYVDSCNYAITDSAPPYCRDCYISVYGRY